MSQLNTLVLRDALIERITDFALDDHFVRDENLSATLRNIWSGPPETGGLGSDLWVEGAFPSTPAPGTMQDLVNCGMVHEGLARQLDSTGAFPLKLTPYLHQWKSIECASLGHGEARREKPAIVVTAGTGAGKTESFLIPLLNELWRFPGEPGHGVSALILYPMNALVNDQVERLDKWLDGQEQVSFFHFTSETPENKTIADRRGVRPATAARFRTRQQARGFENQSGDRLPDGDGRNPDILVTNYSMLEYMLCRPQDSVFFGRNLRVVVLDEAHIYSGNLAAEITLLLRRVLMRCGRSSEEVLCLATSATIGGGPSELRPFAATLFSKPHHLVEVIEGRPQLPKLQAEAATLPLSSDIINQLRENSLPEEETLTIENGQLSFRQTTDENWARWQASLAAIVPHQALEDVVASCRNDRLVGPMLARAVSVSPVFAALQSVLWGDGSPKRIPLRQLSMRLFGRDDGEAIDVTRQLLHCGAIARERENSLPLIANRVHYLMRGPEGILVTFHKDHNEAPGLFPLPETAAKLFSAGTAPDCLGVAASHPLTLFRCTQSGWWGVAGKQRDGHLEPVPVSTLLYGNDAESDLDDETPTQAGQSSVCYYSLNQVEGANRVFFDPATGRCGGKGPITLWAVQECPISKTPLNLKSVGWFAAQARLQLSVLAETALAAMPEYPDHSKAWKPARGRRLLVFSDSRAEAARLGPRLTRQHELQVFRAAVVERIEQINLAASEEDMEQVRQEIDEYHRQLQTASDSMRGILQRRIRNAEQDLRQMGDGGTITDWQAEVQQSNILSELYHLPTGYQHQPGSNHIVDAWNRNRDQINQSIPALLGRELARRPGWPNPSLETLGLVEVFYPGLRNLRAPDEILGVIPFDSASALERLWPDFLAALLDSLRSQGAVTLGNQNNDLDYQYGNGLLEKLFSQDQSFRRSMLPLIGEFVEGPRTSRRNAFTRNVLVGIGMSHERAVELTIPLMRAVFTTLANAACAGQLPWLRVEQNAPTNAGNPVEALQIVFPNLGLRRPAMLYQCEHTGQVWPRSVAGLYPGAASPCLREVPHDQIDQDARLGRRRRELRDWPGFKLGLWAEEHSAQLSPEENARLQNLFREGMRNILSSTTTLELGIDIGGLSAVLLGNLPPGKANYLQRAGRAGRRADGTSAVLGFARPTAYEREVFLQFGRYLDQELRKPTVFLDRDTLVRRHAHAWLLGEFIRNRAEGIVAGGAMDSYGKMGQFTGRPLPKVWAPNETKPDLPVCSDGSVADDFLNDLDALAKNPDPMSHGLKRLWAGCSNLSVDDTLWPDIIGRIKQAYQDAIQEWQGIFDDLLATWREIPAQGAGAANVGFLRAQANAIRYQLLALHNLSVIESLGDARVLPRYGFPIGLSRLRVQVSNPSGRSGSIREEDQFRLQRDSMMALREYAPGSQLLAGGQVITSRGLLKHWTGAMLANEAWGLRGRFVKTDTGLFNYTVTAAPPVLPHGIGQTGDQHHGDFLFPRHGFTTAAWDEPRYGSDFERIGSVEVYTQAFADAQACDLPIEQFGTLEGCVATYRNAGELFLLNAGENQKGFAICQKCGYAESELLCGNGRNDLPRNYDYHTPLHVADRLKRCWSDGEAPVWRNHHLAAKQTTNLLKLEFGGKLDPDLLYTIGQALRLAGAMILSIDERELGLLDPTPDANAGGYRSVILYDALAGGSGHLAELSHPNNPAIHRAWVERAIELLTVQDDGMPESVREREAIRRLLTANCDDSRLVPLRALEFLKHPMFEEPQSQIPSWRHYQDHAVPSHAFPVWINDGEITGVQAGELQLIPFQPGEAMTLIASNQIALIQTPNGEVFLGRWFHSPQNNPERPHRVKIRRSVDAYSQDLTPDEFNQLRVLAVHNC